MPNTPQVIRIEGNTEWVVMEDGGYWIGICDPLHLTLQADTYVELMEDIGTTLDALLNELVETDDFEQFLLKHGWAVQEEGWMVSGGVASTQKDREKITHFDVPYEVRREQPHDFTGRLHQ